MFDLHTHFPLQLDAWPGRHPADLARRHGLAWGNRLRNYGRTPRVTIEAARAGGLSGFVSVLYDPWTEVDPRATLDPSPRDDYARTLWQQLELVEQKVAASGGRAQIARTAAELDQALAQGKLAVVHALESGHYLGATPAAVKASVGRLAAHGVCYITLAHLFYRGIATNVATAELMPERLYHTIFRQPRIGLSDLGRAALAGMYEHGVLVDLKHMSTSAIEETVDLYDRWDPSREVPIMATHGCCRLNAHEATLDDRTIEAIAARGGVLGLTLSRDVLRPESGSLPQRGIPMLLAHVDHLAELTGNLDHVALGSDYDGFIRPVEGLERYPAWLELRQQLELRYGLDAAEAVAQGNALRVLRGAWGRQRPAPVG